MDLCVYHETVEAVATCVVCKQAICAKCQEFGQDGMCGMCVEIASARKAANQANQANKAATASAKPAGTTAGARSPSKPLPQQGRPAAAGAGGGRGTGPLRPPAAKTAVKPGMCPEHPEQAAKAACNHCKKQVCPFCLDVYELCQDCRHLPHCARHESLVGDFRCAGCKMNFCKACMNGTDFCDRCRTTRIASGLPVKLGTGALKNESAEAATSAKSPTGNLKSPTGNLKTPTGSLKKPGTGDLNSNSRAVAAAAAQKQKGGVLKSLKPTQIAGLGFGALLMVILLGKALLGHPRLAPEEAMAALRTEMTMIQKAAEHAQKKNGAYPSTSAALLEQLKADGINVGELALPLKLSVGTDPSEPLAISYKIVGESFEIRALDVEGRPLADNGRDVVLRPSGATVGRRRPLAP